MTCAATTQYSFSVHKTALSCRWVDGRAARVGRLGVAPHPLDAPPPLPPRPLLAGAPTAATSTASSALSSPPATPTNSTSPSTATAAKPATPAAQRARQVLRWSDRRSDGHTSAPAWRCTLVKTFHIKVLALRIWYGSTGARTGSCLTRAAAPCRVPACMCANNSGPGCGV